MSDFSVGQKVRITSCVAREDLTGVETVITEAASDTFTGSEYADFYDRPAYRVAVDRDFRPVASQLEAVE